MAKTKISEFSTTPGNNTDINGINIAEGCAPSGINNAIRELMSDLKEWQSGAMDVYVIPQGTAAAPGIQLYGDLDTGLYGYAANQLGVAVGGASAGYFSSAGWVGNVNGTITGDINATTIDTTNLEVTNIKAKDGTAAITIADSTGVVSVSTQLAVDNLNLSGNTLSSSDTNGNIILAPNGTGDVYLDADTIRVGDSNTNVTITSNGTADLILNTNSGTNSGSITIQDGVNGNILIATNGTGQIQLTGDLDVANIETGAIKARDGTASATIANSTGVMTIASSVLTTTDINGGTIDNTVIGGATTAAGSFTTVTATQLDVDNLRFDANTISSTNTNGNIQIAPAGTGDVYLDADTVRIGDLNSDATLTTNGTADLILNTNSGSLSGSITIQDGVNGNILIAPNGTGQVQLSGALDVTNIEVTNIKAKDGTAALSIADSTGAVTVATAFAANANVTLGDASTDTVQVNGYMGVGGAAISAIGLYVQSSALTGTNQHGITSYVEGNSSATSEINAFWAWPRTAATAFTSAAVSGLRVRGVTKGAGSTITNVNGVIVEDQTQGTNNFGITSAVSSGSNKWNIYASGTAANYFAGNVGIGTSSPAAFIETSSSSASHTNGLTLTSTNSGGYSSYLSWNVFATSQYTAARIRAANYSLNQGGLIFELADGSTPVEKMRLTSTGLGIGTNAPTAKLDVRRGDSGVSGPVIEIGDVTGGTSGRYGGIGYSATAPYPVQLWGGALSFLTGSSTYASATEKMRIDSTGALIAKPAAGVGAVFNEDGVDADFRVESDTNTHALFVEGTNSNVKIGGSAERATTVGTNHLDIFNGTAPVGTLTNGISIYSSSGEAYVMDAAGNATLFSPHDRETNEWIFKSKHTPTGKVLKIDVEKLLRFVNNHFGLDAIQEFIEE